MNNARDQTFMVGKKPDGTIIDVTELMSQFGFDYECIRLCSGFAKKRFDLWLYRHKKEISIMRFNKQKFISLNILTNDHIYHKDSKKSSKKKRQGFGPKCR